MFNARLFLRNHSAIHRWEELPDDVKRLFSSPEGSLVWAEFYIADQMQREYCFEFVQGGQAKLKLYRADIVMVQDAWGMLTLITRSNKNGRQPKSISLDAASIESAVFRQRKEGRREK